MQGFDKDAFEVVSERAYKHMAPGSPLLHDMVELTLANGRKIVGGSTRGLPMAKAAANAAVKVAIEKEARVLALAAQLDAAAAAQGISP